MFRIALLLTLLVPSLGFAAINETDYVEASESALVMHIHAIRGVLTKDLVAGCDALSGLNPISSLLEYTGRVLVKKDHTQPVLAFDVFIHVGTYSSREDATHMYRVVIETTDDDKRVKKVSAEAHSLQWVNRGTLVKPDTVHILALDGETADCRRQP
jgi:hypothetical protein